MKYRIYSNKRHFNDSDGQTSYFPQIFDSQLSQIIESRPACVVTVCKHLQFEIVREYCAVIDTFTFCWLCAEHYFCFYMVYIQQTK